VKTQVDSIRLPASSGHRRYITLGSMSWSPRMNRARLRIRPMLLHVSRQRRGARYGYRAFDMENLHHPRGTTAVSKNEASAQELGPAGAAVAASPTIDTKRNLLYVGTRFLDRHQPAAGRCRWWRSIWTVAKCVGRNNSPSRYGRCRGLRQLSHSAHPGKRQTNHPGGTEVRAIVYALDPDRGGEVLWQTRVADGGIPGGIRMVRPQTSKPVRASVGVWRRSG